MKIDDPICKDCGLLYGSFGLDTTLSHEQWQLINGSPNGLLCANCIIKRASRLPHIIAARLKLEFSTDD
jgi:hypothetical protein